jgi:hypothetical protein
MNCQTVFQYVQDGFKYLMSPTSSLPPDVCEKVSNFAVNFLGNRLVPGSTLEPVVSHSDLKDVCIDRYDVSEPKSEQKDAVGYFRTDASELNERVTGLGDGEGGERVEMPDWVFRVERAEQGGSRRDVGCAVSEAERAELWLHVVLSEAFGCGKRVSFRRNR